MFHAVAKSNILPQTQPESIAALRHCLPDFHEESAVAVKWIWLEVSKFWRQTGIVCRSRSGPMPSITHTSPSAVSTDCTVVLPLADLWVKRMSDLQHNSMAEIPSTGGLQTDEKVGLVERYNL